MLRRLTLGDVLSFSVLVVATFYAVYQEDPYIVLGIMPFYLLGCAKGKRPLTLLALACLPVMFLVLLSIIKWYALGLPLTVLDRFMMQENLVMLAANDYRVAGVLIVLAALVITYVVVLFRGRGTFTRFEKGGALGFVAASAACAYILSSTDLGFLLDQSSDTPSFKAFVRSALIPGAALNLPATADANFSAPLQSLGAPKNGLPDLFFVLQESTFDPQKLDPSYQPKTLFNKSQPITGPLHVHTVDGGTWLSEFSLLTQVRPQEFGDGGWYVFHQLPGRIDRSLFTKLKELGYRTVVVYPVPGFFLNARQFYKSIGADDFYDPAQLGIGKGWDWKIPDSRFYQALEKKVDELGDQPIAAMMLTINQHGPHDPRNPSPDYLARYGQSDIAYGDFLDYLKQRGKPAGVTVFGDHQPQFTDTIFEDKKGRELTNYEIRCINFACNGTRSNQIDITLLAPIALEHFGFQIDDLSRYEERLFAGCASDVSKCADDLRQKFNEAFSVAFH